MGILNVWHPDIIDFINSKREKGQPTLTQSHLQVVARIPGLSEETFQAAANKAKAGCPISRVLSTEITMDAKLES